MTTEKNDSEIENELKKLGYWNTLYSEKNYFGTGPTLLALFAKDIIQKYSVQNILELGCGQGRDSIFFASIGCNVTGTDISKKAIDFVTEIKKQENLDNLKLFIHDVRKPFDFSDTDFDLVYSNLALQFFDIRQLSNIFSNIKKIMKKNSFFLFSTKKPGDKYFNFGQKISKNAFESKGITRYFYDKYDIQKLLEEKYFTMLHFDDEQHTNPDKTISVWWKILVKI